jgi:hypothetical protein
MTTPTNLLTAARAEALFTTDLPTGTHPTRTEATAAIRTPAACTTSEQAKRSSALRCCDGYAAGHGSTA